jgi:ubiquinone/menaquinone biosynthesis C-methylase UbiE
MLQNKKFYDATDAARLYALESNLRPPEETILRIMLPHLPTAKMLDIGVGGGRTTLHFAKWVRAYVGTDYSDSMITECRKRFSGYPEHISFMTCDARSMEMFAAGSFDFVLFSFNGIDYVSHDDRLKILQEVRRVGKPGGYFCFSTHNLNWAANLFELRRMISFDPRLARRTAKRIALRYFYNWRVRAVTVRNSPYAAINDGAHGGKLLTYFIRPLEQIAQLKENFTDIRVFSLATGAEIEDPGQLKINEDNWLHYLCRMK